MDGYTNKVNYRIEKKWRRGEIDTKNHPRRGENKTLTLTLN